RPALGRAGGAVGGRDGGCAAGEGDRHRDRRGAGGRRAGGGGSGGAGRGAGEPELRADEAARAAACHTEEREHDGGAGRPFVRAVERGARGGGPAAGRRWRPELRRVWTTRSFTSRRRTARYGR